MRRVLRLLVPCAAFAALAAAARVDAQVLAGTVQDSATAAPIADARVTAWTADGTLGGMGTTAADGRYEIRLPEGGAYRLVVERLGYVPGRTGTLTVADGARLELALALRPRPLVLDGVEARVRATPPFRNPVARGFYERMEAGWGRFLTPEQVAARQPAAASDLLRDVPGVSFRDGLGGRELWVGGRARGCEPSVFVDGIRLELHGAPLDDLVPSSRVWGIEVYRYRWEMPQSLLPENLSTFCGAVVIWTFAA